jgi:N-glycosylase/DNA lyase
MINIEIPYTAKGETVVFSAPETTDEFQKVYGDAWTTELLRWAYLQRAHKFLKNHKGKPLAKMQDVVDAQFDPRPGASARLRRIRRAAKVIEDLTDDEKRELAADRRRRSEQKGAGG